MGLFDSLTGSADAPPPPKTTKRVEKAAKPILGSTKKYGGRAASAGLQDLIGLFKSGGQIDPLAMNFELADMARATGDQQRQARERFAGSGFGAGSGVEQAVTGAIGQAGDEMMARRRAQENADAMARRMQMTQVLMQLLGLGGNLSGQAIQGGLGQNQLQLQADMGNVASNSAMLGGLLGAGSTLGAASMIPK